MASMICERERLAERQVAQGEIAQQALAVAGADRAGLVDGVVVDFRHYELPIGEWEARAWWYVASNEPHCAGVIFPSERASVDRAIAKLTERQQGVEPTDDWIVEKLSLPEARPGDRLFIDKVVDQIVGGPFHHRHDATVKQAHLVLRRADGSEVALPKPLTFYGSTQLRTGPARDAFDRLAERIMADHGRPDPRTLFIQTLDLPLGQRAAIHLDRAEAHIAQLLDAIETAIPNSRDQARMLVRHALNEATLAAFLQAKHESQKAEVRAAKTDAILEKGRGQKNEAWHTYASAIWNVEPQTRRSSIFKRMVIDGIAEEDERRSVLRSLKSNPLCPK